jgi:hypothetical protein
MKRKLVSDNNRITIRIGFRGFLTRFDLDEVISSIDGLVQSELLLRIPVLRQLPVREYPRAPRLSYVGIVGVRPGSIVLVTLIGGAVAGYVVQRFKKGVALHSRRSQGQD